MRKLRTQRKKKKDHELQEVRANRRKMAYEGRRRSGRERES